MKKIEERSTAQSAQTAADPSKFMKAQSLHLNKQTIRTLTGAELRVVGGGCLPGTCICTHTNPHLTW